MALVNFTDDPRVTDTILLKITTPDIYSCLVSNPYKIDNVTVYYIERDFLGNNFGEYIKSVSDPLLQSKLELARQNLCNNPSQDNIYNVQKILDEIDSSAQKNTFYFKDRVVSLKIGNENFPAWLSTDIANSALTLVDTATFTYEWNPNGSIREGDYFLCWTWTPLAAGDKLSSNIQFHVQGDPNAVVSIPTHITPHGKYETLLERYLPEMYKQFIADSDETPQVLDALNQSIANGFTFIENQANQIIDLFDANAIHESLLAYLSNLFGIKLKSDDPTLWRRQIKQAIPLFKKKGTLPCLEEAFSQAGMKLNLYTQYWQIVSPYTWVESFKVTDNLIFPLTKNNIILPIDPNNFSLWLKRVGQENYVQISNSYVTFYTDDYGVINMMWVADQLSSGGVNLFIDDRLKVVYQYREIPSGQQSVENYIQSLPLADQRDESSQEFPLKNWNVRLISEDDPMFNVLVPTTHPFYDPITFGWLRTQFAYSENIYNMEEYNGCVTKDTIVVTENGTMMIGDITNEKFILSEFGLRKFSGLKSQGLKPTLSVNTKMGRKIVATYNHKFKVMDYNCNFIWKKCHELNKGDLILCKKGSCNNENKEIDFIKKIFNSNGSFIKNEPTFTFENNNLLNKIQNILLAIGISSRIEENNFQVIVEDIDVFCEKFSINYEKTLPEISCLKSIFKCIEKNNAMSFINVAKLIKLNNSIKDKDIDKAISIYFEKNKNYDIVSKYIENNWFFDKVAEIIDVGNNEVFDPLDVEETSSYVSNGMISHNSTRPSLDPCNIDKYFLDPCSACLGSKYSVDIEVNELSNDRMMEVQDILKEYTPFHCQLHSINFSGEINEFVQQPVETIESLITIDYLQNIISGNVNSIFNRYIIDGLSGSAIINRQALADQQTVLSGKLGKAYNDHVAFVSPDFDIEGLGIGETSHVLEVLSPSSNAGTYQIDQCSGKTARIKTSVSEPLDNSAFTFNLSNILYQNTFSNVSQDDQFVFSDNSIDFSFLGVKSNWDIDNTIGYTGSAWKILIPTYSSTAYEIDKIIQGNLYILDNLSLPISNVSGINYSLYDDNNNLIANSTSGVLNVIRRGRVDLNDLALISIDEFIRVGDKLYYNGVEYPIVELKNNSFWFSDYTDGNASGVSIQTRRRLIDMAVGYFGYKGLRLRTWGDHEVEFGMINGDNPPAINLQTDDSKFIENFLFLINGEFYKIYEIDGKEVVLAGREQDWMTLSAGGTAVAYSIVHFQSKTVDVSFTVFDQINRNGSDTVIREINSTIDNTVAINALSMSQGSGIEQEISQDEGITFIIETNGQIVEGAL